MVQQESSHLLASFPLAHMVHLPSSTSMFKEERDGIRGLHRGAFRARALANSFGTGFKTHLFTTHQYAQGWRLKCNLIWELEPGSGVHQSPLESQGGHLRLRSSSSSLPSDMLPCLLACPWGQERRESHSECLLPFFFFSSSPSLAPKRVKMIPVWELTPTAVTNIRPEPSMTWVPVGERRRWEECRVLHLAMLQCKHRLPSSPMNNDTQQREGKVKSWGHLK